MTVPTRTFSADTGDQSTGSGGADALETDIDAIIAALSALISASTTDYVLPSTNLLTNGGFETWQRGAGPFTTAVYTADRWEISSIGAGSSVQIDREGTTKKTNSLYSAKVTYTHGANSYIEQRLVIADGFHHLLGKVISLRGSVNANAASAIKLAIGSDGTGGSVSYTAYHAGNSAFANLDALNYTVPTDATYIVVRIYLYATVTAYVDNFILVPGPIALDYMPLHPAEEMQRCQRYYEVHGGVNNGNPIIRAASGGNYVYGQTIPFNTVKAGIPTMTKNGTWAVTNSDQPAAAGINVNGYELYATAAAAGTAYTYPNGTDDTVTAEYNP